jgi:hypothetical protein
VLVGIGLAVFDGRGVAVDVEVGILVAVLDAVGELVEPDVLLKACGELGTAVLVGWRVAVGTGAGVRVFVGTAVEVPEGVAVDGMGVNAAVSVKLGGNDVGAVVGVGVMVGGSPCKVKLPDAFQPVPTKICTS